MSDTKETALAADTLLARLLSSLSLDPKQREWTPLISTGLVPVAETQVTTPEDRLLSSLAAMLLNVEPNNNRFDKAKVFDAVGRIDKLVNEQVNEILHSETFQQMESTWRGLEDLASNINFKANISVDILDVTKDELYEDFENNSSDIFGAALFDKIYVAEYDQYGGRPYGVIIGDYSFKHNPRELFWLRSMAKVAAASHAPFIASVAPEFFGCKTIEEVEAVRSLEGILNHPKYGAWNAFRDSEEACYLGLTFPRFILRKPWHPDTNPVPGMNFTEVASGDSSKYLWGNAVWLFGRNLGRSFAESGWCQYIRGPKGGGIISGLPVDTFNIRGEDEMMVPVELVIPDYRELEFAKSGFIPLVYRKSSADATFFSVQSVKAPRKLKDPKDAENSQLVTNLSYTFSITRIAHYVKSIMRDNIGTTADAAYIKKALNNWIMQFVTTTVNPDDLTLRAFPFKAADITVVPKPGQIGWYKSTISVLPHVQFEGMDVELRLESRLG
jgi:type VI secretion system protein ImpC